MENAVSRAASPFLDRAKRFVEIHEERQKLKALDGALSQQMEDLRSLLIDDFLNGGFDRVSVSGGTIYLHEQIWAKSAENATGQMVASALRKAKLDEYVTYGSQALSGYVREIIKAHEKELAGPFNEAAVLGLLPKALRGVLSITNKTDLRVRKS